MSDKSFENMTVEERMAFCNASVVKMGRRPCVPITRPCTRIERPCKPIVRPCKRITRPCVPVERPANYVPAKICPYAQKLAEEQNENNLNAIKQETSSNALMLTKSKVILAIGGAMESSTRCMQFGFKEYGVTPDKIFYWDQTNEIVKHILKDVSPKAQLVLVGHSYGGDTAINVAKELKDAAPERNISYLITIDPVSWSGYLSVSKPASVKEWINIFAKPKERSNFPDFIAGAGGAWNNCTNADFNYAVDAHHEKVDIMLEKADKLSGGKIKTILK